MATLEELRWQCENILKMPDGTKKEGLIVAARETLDGYLAGKEISAETHRLLVELLSPDRP